MSLVIETVGQQSGKDSALRKYLVRGAATKTLAYALVNAAAPATWDGFVKQTPKIKELGGELWEGRVPYGVMEAGEEGDIGWSFEIGTQSFHMAQALEHLADYAADDGEAPDHKGAIGVSGSPANREIAGTDILIPFFQWEETHYIAYETVATHAFIANLENLVGTINGEAFRIWGPSELLLLGVSGAKQGEKAVGLTYRFASSRTRINFVAGDITIPEKLGHNYLWFEYALKEQSGAGAVTSRPIAAHYERVYDWTDWSDLALPDPWN